MNKKMPLVSVLMTAYNAEKYITQAIKSILKQTYSNWELVIVDDGSTDKTATIAHKFSLQDARIRVYEIGHNTGPSHASNYGLKRINSTLVARMDADDISHPLRLEKQVEFLLRHPEVVVVGGTCKLIDSNGTYLGMKPFPLEHEEVYQALYRMNPIQHPSCMINLGLLPKKKLTYHNGSLLAHDLEMLYEVAQYGKLANMPDVLLYYRQHPHSLSLKNPKETFAATREVRKKAVKRYGYTPNFTSTMIHLLQKMIVTCLPAGMIYPLFTLLRTGKRMILKGKNEQEAFGVSEKVERLSELSVFVPAYNEEQNLTEQAEQILGVLPKLAKRYELIIVNDGSTDKTGMVADKLARNNLDVRVIHQENLGYGGALKTGFREAKYGWIFFTDSDLQFDINELRYLVERTPNVDMVLGFRRKRAEGMKRQTLALLLKLWVWTVLGFPMGVKDIDCAFKLIKTDVIRSILPLSSDGAMISTEILLKAIRAGYRFDQVGVSHLPRVAGNPTGSSLLVIMKAVYETFVLRAEIKQQKHLVKPALAVVKN